jgi:AcrR family transcriptional regulator
MPRPRFDKLDPVVRARLLEAAALEFSSSSYADASLNRIIEQAGISKGSLYYYFDDKEDLFRAVLAYLSECSEGLFESVPSDLTAPNFWTKLEEFGNRGREVVHRHPWIVGFMRMLHSTIENPPPQGPLKQWCARLLKIRADIMLRGLELGVIRTDMPLELLLKLLSGVEMTMNQWIFSHWDELSVDQREGFGRQMLDVMRRIIQVQPAADHPADQAPAPRARRR